MNKPWYKKWWGISILLFLTIILIFIVASIFYVIDIVKKIKSGEISSYNVETVADKELLKKIEGENNYWIGSNDPKITIVEFGDFSCSLCKSSFSKLREIGKNHSQNVKIIFRDFPVVNEYSSDLALAGRCAGEQGLFWVMYDKLYLNQGVSQENEILELAKQIGVEEEKFKICFESKKYSTAIQKDLADGFDLEIQGTPTFFINGYKIEGDIPYDTFIKIIDQLLNN